ncbi:hypothetical protein G3A_22900 [Bacillus sp. 17376]|nr:hypothetical protein G3A_22900 [Bacillus sp. 17376]
MSEAEMSKKQNQIDNFTRKAEKFKKGWRQAPAFNFFKL